MSASRTGEMLKSIVPAMFRRTSCRDPDRRTSVAPRLAWRTRLEALVQPVILLGHLASAILDKSIHAPGVVLHARPGEILPRRIKARDIAASARQLARDARNNARARHAR